MANACNICEHGCDAGVTLCGTPRTGTEGMGVAQSHSESTTMCVPGSGPAHLACIARVDPTVVIFGLLMKTGLSQGGECVEFINVANVRIASIFFFA